MLPFHLVDGNAFVEHDCIIPFNENFYSCFRVNWFFRHINTVA